MGKRDWGAEEVEVGGCSGICMQRSAFTIKVRTCRHWRGEPEGRRCSAGRV